MKKLPDGWKVVELKNLFDIKKGKKVNIADDCNNNGIPYIGIENLRGVPISQYTFDNNGLLCEKEDILLVWDGANCGTVGSGLTGYVGSTISRLKIVDKSVDKDYVFRFLKSKFEYFNSNTTGATIPHLDKKNVLSLKIPLPPLTTQKKIAAVLEKAEKLREWRKEADRLTDRFLENTFLDIFGDPEKNPMGWDIVKFGEIVEASMNGFGRRSEENLEKKPIVLRIQDIQNGYIDISSPRRISMSSEEFQKYELKENDFLYVRVNGTLKLVGKSAIVPEIQEDVTFSDHIVRIRFYQKMVRSLYVHFLTQTQYYRLNLYSKVVTTAGQNSLGFNRLSEILIPLPPLPLQQKFVHIVQQVEQIREHQTQSRQHIENFFNVLMQRAFRGELEAK